ncbi:ABC-2 type transport system permease protein [Parafrankia irregularis]|uniref:ABC-2 type transport system permease protein n=1 Tax=Parafrankia irregularis TaxID=795642 RepID=A0A0S4QR95_9ACTN|nr:MULTISPECIES: ABC transporter permease [Parafrankia]MBE3204394.1 ABC transporter permease [Parafrankia sp. CH37]CUU57663.1 ABC-2 type transport system permease protein [Parafrankia irregularis]
MSTGADGGSGGDKGQLPSVPTQGGTPPDDRGAWVTGPPAASASGRAAAGTPEHGGFPPLAAWVVVRLVAGRELAIRLRSKVFVITTAAFLVLLVGASVVISMLGGHESAKSVGLLAAESVLADPLEAVAGGLGVDVATREVPDEATGLREVSDGDLDVLVTAAPSGLRVAVKEELGEDLRGVLAVLARQQVLDNEISVLGGDPARVNETVAAAGLDVAELDPVPDDQDERLFLGLASAFLIYMGLMLFGPAVSQGVVEEKSSRVVELLLSTVRPWTLMAGKVLGIGLVALIQMVVIAGGGLVAALTTGALELPSSEATGTVVWSVAWYVIGFFLYALPFAAVGAMVSRQEDLGGISSPIVLALIVPWVVGVSIVPGDPDNGLVEILSLVPLFSPLLMPMRIALGVAPLWQLVLSVLLALALIGLLIRITGRIYHNAVLRTGARVAFKEAVRRA